MRQERVDTGADAVRSHDVGYAAWIDLSFPPDTSGDREVLVIGAARRVERAVRSDDRVCPVAAGVVAVQFGPVASDVPPEVLGDRLARALCTPLPGDPRGTVLRASVGMAVPAAGDDPGRIAHRARAAAGSAARVGGLTAAPGGPTATVLVIDEPVTGDRITVVRPDAPGHVPVHRRTVVHGAPAGPPRSSANLADRGRPGAARTAAGGSGGSCVLVVDPMALAGRPVGYPTSTVVSVVERLGHRAGTAVVSPDDPLDVTIDGQDVDLVILVLDGAWVGRSPSWSTGAWGRPARLTTAYADKGVPVLAVSAGAGAGAVAACVAQGALALFSVDGLAESLASLDTMTVDEARQVAELAFPVRFRALLDLTAGERRVLFYLTEGWAAQDVADELVVSLTTVRSHIRSVLRKLEVRSQLAAVAIANSRDLEHHRVTPNA